MKTKFLNLILLAGVLLSATSCVDLTQEPQSFISEEDYYKIEGATQKSIPGLYYTLWHSNYGFNCRIMRLNTQADDITVSPNKPANLLNNINRLSPALMANAKDFEMVWDNLMNVINESNRLIYFSEIPTDEKKATSMKQALGEAYFMRGLAYFYAVRIFGDCPLLEEPSKNSAGMPRVAVADIYSKMIVPSLEQAIEWLPKESRSHTSATPSKYAAQACLADVYMNMAGWPLKKDGYYAKAADLAKTIIESNQYRLQSSYADLWKEENKESSPEFIFALHHSLANKVPSQYGKSFYPIDFYPNAGWADYYGDLSFYEAFPNDERKAWNYMTEWEAKVAKQGSEGETEVKTISFKDSKDGLPAISKYYDYNNGKPGKSQLSNGVTSIYRYADVLLMYAEASTLATGQVNDLALNCLNQVQERAKAPKTTTKDAKAFDEAVFAEKGWEFLAEGRRWFDLVRREKVAEKRSEVWEGSFYQKEKHYYYAIPQTQIDLTSWENNAGY